MRFQSILALGACLVVTFGVGATMGPPPEANARVFDDGRAGDGAPAQEVTPIPSLPNPPVVTTVEFPPAVPTGAFWPCSVPGYDVGFVKTIDMCESGVTMPAYIAGSEGPQSPKVSFRFLIEACDPDDRVDGLIIGTGNPPLQRVVPVGEIGPDGVRRAEIFINCVANPSTLVYIPRDPTLLARVTIEKRCCSEECCCNGGCQGTWCTDVVCSPR